MHLLCYIPLLAATASAIWPIPSSYSHGDGLLWICESVRFTYNGAEQAHFGPYGHSGDKNTSSSNKIVNKAIERTLETLFKQNFVPWKFHPRFSDFEPDVSAKKVLIKTIALKQNETDPEDILQPATGSVDESYALTVSDGGDAMISAVTSIGLARGLTTFTQLFYEHTGGGVYSELAPVSIEDAPKFAWRGLNLDTARTFQPTEDIYRTIDALAYSKFNRLHWHITDAQSWPLELPSMPEVADKGAYIGFQKYSPADVQAVQEYGALVGVEVVMEIDQPGHTASIWHSHPELIAAFEILSNWDTYAAEPPSGTLKLNSTAVYDFLEKLFDDLLPRLKPLTSYFHLGGDEVNKNAYSLDDTVRSNEPAVLQPLMQKLMDRNMKQITGAGLIPLVWEEMLLDWNLTLPKSTIVQSWQSDSNVAEITSKGYRVVTGNYNFWYLDCGYGQWLDFRPGAASQGGFWPYNDYCSPRKNWRLMYSYDPLSGVPANETHLVVGGETHIWSEQTDNLNLDSKVWPRACAAAEVLWSGAKDASGQNRSQIAVESAVERDEGEVGRAGCEGGAHPDAFLHHDRLEVCALNLVAERIVKSGSSISKRQRNETKWHR